MPARKSKKTVRSSAGQMIPYGDPIRGAIARGDVQEMRKLATHSRKWIKDVESALSKLERKIQTLEKSK
jgi:Domain of unknown function (DUF1843)